ncbi:MULTISPECIES: SigB/SigF/SigG family RNA polymerase sigma factor [Streptomyces]|uniref:RNA polymerase subunit sigma n=1 Tax=Streptomyces amritsarensis TaxID=681158 RepID=A0ABX3FYR1_9ACTN|nr:MULTISPECIES: SigB/SigF/SigG family RNA polymerase sigma factor [Streptomyces]AQT76029.1 RNA polymerase subunit sigma [Streptomyces sp. fd1-xmd]OLZ62352.1 RNA polymerase subunit sigma [Streptomyces amritsarensis]
MTPLRDTLDPAHTGYPVDTTDDTLEIPENPLAVSTDDARSLSVALFHRLRSLAEGTAEYSYVRNTLVELNLSLVKYAARRFRNRSEPFEDIVQVGTIGLIKAINRYDVERGVEFATFAVPTITGEMKRFFRDTSWSVKVPRRLQELRLDMAKCCDAMEQDLGRRPTDHELAEHLGVSDDALAEGRQAANCYVAESLSTSVGQDADGGALPRSLGSEEEAYERIEDLETLKPLLNALGERDRLVLQLRFGEELTQSQIGERLGISQMHVSRLLSRIMARLRTGMLEDPLEGPGDGEGHEDAGAS